MRSAKDNIEAQAASLLIKLDADPSPGRQAELDAWLGDDARRRVAYARLAIAWKRFDALRRIRPLDMSVDVDVLKHPAEFAPHRALQVPRFRKLSVALGAILVLTLGIAWVISRDQNSRTYETAVGGREHVVLDDGSIAELNTNTRIRVRYTDAGREIDLLQGESLFAVVHDTARPFRVTAAGVTAWAVGTRFAVRLREGGLVETLVAEGRVAVLQPIRVLGIQIGQHELSRILVAGDRALMDSKTAAITRMGVDAIQRRLSWTVGRLRFHGETLYEVVREFNRYVPRKFELLDPKTGAKPVAGAFDPANPDQFAKSLEAAFGTRVVRTVGSEDRRKSARH